MRTARALVATDPRRFGRAEPLLDDRPGLADEVQLFAATFAAGFLFVTILIA